MSDPIGDPVEAALTRAAWQPALLARDPRRMELLRMRPTWPLRRSTVRVHRNHAFELVTAAWAPFCAFAGLDVVPVLGGYDDSLDLAGAEDPVDLHVVSLDLERFRARVGADELLDWLVGRLAELARRSSAPVVVGNWPADDAEAFNDALAGAVLRLPGVAVADVAAVARELGPGFLDPRRSEVTGTPWSAAAQLEVARAFGLRWLPASLLPPVKAVLVDLDDTLYGGVLGEDGPAGLRLEDGHRELQELLVRLHGDGVYVGVVSRNDPADVAELFRVRDDFPLPWSVVSASAVGWGSKADGVRAVADQLRIGVDAVAFLDDNPGELATVAAAHPAVRTLHAPDPGLARRALELCPGLFRWRTTEADALRAADLVTAGVRATGLAAADDPDDYLRSLQVRLQVRRDDPADLPRVAQLAERTNQFTTALLRPGEVELARRRADGSLSWVAVSLRDRLADSGTVGAVLARREGRRVVVEGVSISCRALGRRVETAMVESAVALLADDGVDEVAFAHARGPRNRAALDWLAGYAGADLADAGEVVVPWDPRGAEERAAQGPVVIEEAGRHGRG